MFPTSLYIHIPWCIRKCPYCDFNSHKSPASLPEESYVQALVADFKADLTHFPAREIHSIFIGGGTPSLFSAHAYESLFNQLQQLVKFSSDIEITLEANPGTVEQQRFNDYRRLGINRLSLGIQSFNPIHLQALGRIHDALQAHKAIEAARQAGFDNINIDIMYSLPRQSVAEGLEDLQTALAHQPEHLSWYQLTIEPNTVFYKKRPPLPNEEEACTLEEQGLALLAAHDFKRYEISAFCQQEKFARHNLNYWLFGDYYGIGAGAHGKISLGQTIYRTRKQRQPADYLASDKAFLVERETVAPDSLLFEFMLNATRLEQAIPHALFSERTGLPFDRLHPLLVHAASKGLITLDERFWQITPFGRRYTNDLQALFLPD
ncbi:radical SAM family heme chaperone HemW [Legionella feeleii]|uniref:Heme chaperone HemW n=1 Tax=Legionella feeleii TaxID=453 RepID=A0A0W0U0E5_9GAMM|nr:radical SAM family heme chaperone HemW [Legionella feeleii]KTD01226.1 oxygen-independent coproporphyrinogen III oxidase [Legionella feeleii]SPX60532.1 oxygen-independent coproporphyrinogen III oxidase [Legionella feeleii]